MEFVPWKTFGRIIDRHKGDAGTRTLDCADLFRVMAFAQLTWRESPRDIEVCLASNQAKLFHTELTAPPARSTLANALNQCDWRIYHALARRLDRGDPDFARASAGMTPDQIAHYSACRYTARLESRAVGRRGQCGSAGRNVGVKYSRPIKVRAKK